MSEAGANRGEPSLRATQPTGLHIVAIGGGTGMPQLLRGLRAYTDNITAIVTVADDGGSSGRLRQQMGVLPPGDFRNNIAALSDAEDLMTRLLQYRFAKHDASGASNELAGHSFGNLLIATMAAVTGSFEKGLAECSRVLAVRGRVLPSTLDHITLCAEIAHTQADGSESWTLVEGESVLPETGGRIQRVFLKPDQPHAYPEVIRWILRADLIVAGPGSFFTSVIPNLLVPAIRDAICATAVPRIYLCNVATQPGETDGYTVSDHMRHLRYHAGDAFTTVLANDNYDPAHPPYQIGEWVTLPAADEVLNYRLFTGDVVDAARPWHHHPQKLAARLMAVYAELTGASLP
ncbi:MAG: YvcK family protein [Caldilineaceae bacterium]|nr:YvcK family protein [Caldilineaceae bacterium]